MSIINSRLTTASEIPQTSRANVAILMRDGYFAVYPDLTLRPNSKFSRAKMLGIIRQIYEKEKMDAEFAKRHRLNRPQNGKLDLKIRQDKTRRSQFAPTHLSVPAIR